MLPLAILLDGGFVRQKIGSTASPLTGDRVSQLIDWITGHHRLQCCRLHRVYFYDAKPLDLTVKKPLQGAPVNFAQSTLSANNRKLHEALVRVPFVSMRMGELSFGGWRLGKKVLNGRQATSATITEADLRPDVRQKGVDMRIGLDIAALTLKEHVKVIALVTGDSDFVPAMKFARREGAQLLLFTLGHGVYDSMREHSDLVVDERPPKQAVKATST